jgi:four helix bundle protein
VLGAGCGTRFASSLAWVQSALPSCGLGSWLTSSRSKSTRAILAKPEAQADRRFYDQLSDAVRSTPRNLAEGFGRYHHREFAHFTRIARSSLKETQNHILDAHDRRLIDQQVLERLWELSDKAIASTTVLLKYLTGRKDR